MSEREELQAAIAEQQLSEASQKRAQEALDAAGEYLGTIERERGALKARSDNEIAQHGLVLVDAFRAGRDVEMAESETAMHLMAIERKHAAAATAYAQLETELTSATDRVKAAETKSRQAVAAVLRAESLEIARQILKADETAERLRLQLKGLDASRTSFHNRDGLRFLSAEAVGAMTRTERQYPSHHSPVTEHAQAWREHIERLKSDPEDSFLPR